MNLVDTAVAARHILKAERILVIGCSGGGKSTLALSLCERFGLDYISIDRDIHWLPGWVERNKDERRVRIIERVAAERWVMDGTNTSTFDIRVPRSDMVIWVRMPRFLCLWGAVSRWFKFIGRTRPEMAPGCVEKIDIEFLHFIWTYEQKYVPRIKAALERHGPHVPVLELKSRRQMRELLDLVGGPA
jgi:adenylate kinase family enzyme